jgi:multidrug resistance efflux pump
MKRTLWMTLLACGLVLCACGNPSAPAPATVAPILLDTGPSRPNIVTASAEVNPAVKSSISFLISAPVREVFVKPGDQVKAGDPLIILDTPDLEGAVLGAQAEIRKQEVEWRFFLEDRKYEPPERRELEGAQVKQAQAALVAAQATLAQGTLNAPYDGTIVAVELRPGEIAQPGQMVLTMGVLNSLQVETTDLSEGDIPYVKIGQPAQVYVEALDTDLSGIVSAISPISNDVGGDAVYKVTIKLDQQPDGLLWGMTAEVQIEVQE